MIRHSDITGIELRHKLKRNQICFGGNLTLKIYGRLDCRSGKRMKKQNRVFFASEQEAIQLGFRPCGHCMRKEYKNWLLTFEKPAIK